jgi:hypothetical protein
LICDELNFPEEENKQNQRLNEDLCLPSGFFRASNFISNNASSIA